MMTLLPTARSLRSLREAFLRLSGGKVALLPRMATLGETEGDVVTLFMVGAGMQAGLSLPPAMSSLRRQLLLARAVLAAGGRLAHTQTQALRLAQALAKLVDEAASERLGFERLRDLAPDDYAEHWQDTLSFLSIIMEHWPRILEQEGALDPARERDCRLTALAEAWSLAPPPFPVIAAGSTGSIPAAADLLAATARLPQGAVILPGLDCDLDRQSWEALEPTHPQFGMKALLTRLGVDRDAVKLLACPPMARESIGWSGAPTARMGLLRESLRPSLTTAAWRDLPPLPPDALAGLGLIEASGPEEEAGCIALILREALETPGRTAALVTADRHLARRTASELGRWGIEVDDSAGRPLVHAPVGVFLCLLMDAGLEDEGHAAFLALLKHPLAMAGLGAGGLRRGARLLERHILRGRIAVPGLVGIRDAWGARKKAAQHPSERGEGVRPSWQDEEESALEDVLHRLLTILEPFFSALADGKERPLNAWIDGHLRAAEALAAEAATSGAERLWCMEDGEVASQLLHELRAAADGHPPLDGRDYRGVVGMLMHDAPVRRRYGTHPRLHIFGLMEARLQQYDIMVLGGLNEGTWPPAPPIDPWMSRPMRARFGLPSPERLIGLSAHDFVQAMGAPTVWLTRSGKVDGAPATPSRWLLRLRAVLEKAGLPRDALCAAGAGYRRLWQRLDWPARVQPCTPPSPTPPLKARPRRLPVTAIETWMRDPYALYARYILGLRPLEPLGISLDNAVKGEALHAIFHAFIASCPDRLPPDALQRFLSIGAETLAPLMHHAAVAHFWWPRFERMATWFVATERKRRPRLLPVRTETQGMLTLAGPAGPFILTAKADRIDRDQETQALCILDYKTGSVPNKTEVGLGKSPQLPLEALIAQEGGFAGLAPAPTEALEYWRLTGHDPAGTILPLDDVQALTEAARSGLLELIAHFDNPATPYHSQPRPDWRPRYSDYDHLARLKEWSAFSDE
jgi:ATP-dependent helicase/nuclease subunit B